jgi:hypothetical protein
MPDFSEGYFAELAENGQSLPVFRNLYVIL